MIYFNDLKSQWLEIKDSTMPEIAELFETSQFILGPQVERFENSFAKFCSCSYGVGVSNGTDAIKIAAKALGLGRRPDIFMPANTFVATWLAVKEAYPNSKVIMIDIDQNGQMDTAKLNEKITKGSLIVAVHMYGCCDNIEEINRIADKNQCLLMEDASQAHGAKTTRGTIAGSVGDIAAFSLYPGKNLGAAGDAGIITTNNESLAKKCRLLRNYGSEEKYIHKEIGHNHRLDSLQAIILYWKLKKLNEWNQSRSISANTIKLALDNPEVEWMLTDNPSQVYHILPVLLKNLEKRSAFMKYLNDNKVQCGIHYPVPIHKMPFYDKQEPDLTRTENYADRIVSLPIHPFMMDIEIQYIVDTINKFRG